MEEDLCSYLRVVPARLLSALRLLDWFPPVSTYCAEFFVTSPDPWITLEGLVFRTEYAFLYAVTWMREIYCRYRLWFMPSDVCDEISTSRGVLSQALGNETNVSDLFALMTV